MKYIFSALLLAPVILFGQSPGDLYSVYNFNSIIQKNATGKKMRVAILDNDFGNWQQEVGRTLPKTTTFHEGPVKRDRETSEDAHGLAMAQLFQAILTKDYSN